MALVTGQALLQCVAERILAKHLERVGMTDVTIVHPWPSPSNHGGVDLTYRSGGMNLRAKVKPDAYFGKDAAKAGNRDLAFYRAEGPSYGIEAIADAATREPGWIFNSDADELHYYLCAISHAEDEIAALMNEPDELFFSELRVDRDELHTLPMHELRKWFEAHFEEYTPRPVMLGGRSAWFRFIPRNVIDSAVPGIRVTRDIFGRLNS